MAQTPQRQNRVIFELHYEDWNHALHIASNGHSSLPIVFEYLLPLLKRAGVTPIVYVLGRCTVEQPMRTVDLQLGEYHLKSHGYWHDHGEQADRKPYEYLGWCGGFFMRILPYWLWKRSVIKQGRCYIHPHDLDEHHPRLRNPWFQWKRRVGLKTAKRKLERLVQEVFSAD